MTRIILRAGLIALLALGSSAAPLQAAPPSGAALFKGKCSSCHDLTRSGPWPAVKDFSRDAATLREVIRKGKKLMPTFENKLSGEEIESLIEYIRSQQD